MSLSLGWLSIYCICLSVVTFFFLVVLLFFCDDHLICVFCALTLCWKELKPIKQRGTRNLRGLNLEEQEREALSERAREEIFPRKKKWKIKNFCALEFPSLKKQHVIVGVPTASKKRATQLTIMLSSFAPLWLNAFSFSIRVIGTCH